MQRIDTKRGREALGIRREPYWYKLARDRHLGLRKLTERSAGAWIARFRDESGVRRYQALGECTDAFDFDEAKVAAETWFRDLEQGVQSRGDDGQPATVAVACMAYVRALRAEGRLDAAHDAHMRFRRTVYGRLADAEFGPKARTPVQQADGSPPPASPQPSMPAKRRKWDVQPHDFASLPISKLHAPRVKVWLLDLVAAGLSKAAANRTLTALKAALNKAVADRRVSPVAAQEWAAVAPLPARPACPARCRARRPLRGADQGTEPGGQAKLRAFPGRLHVPALTHRNRGPEPVTDCDRLKHHDPRFPPDAFTEHGAIMATTVLNSPRAVEMSVTWYVPLCGCGNCSLPTPRPPASSMSSSASTSITTMPSRPSSRPSAS